MRAPGILLGAAVAVALGALGMLVPPAAAHAGTSCQVIVGVGVGQASPDGATTTATIRGGGALTGTTRGTFHPTGVSGTVVSIAGTVVFTPVPGAGGPAASSLTAEVTGTFDTDPASGAFRAETGAVAGTGRLAGATADLVLEGVQDDTGHFTETVRGELCLNRAR